MQKNSTLYPILFAALIGILWILLISNEPVSDQLIYHNRATSLAKGLGYVSITGQPTAYWAPGYAFYLSFFYKLFSPSYPVAFFANLLCFLSLVAGITTLGTLLYGEKVGKLCGWITALYPSFLFYTTIIASELLFLTLTIWTFYCLFYIRKASTWKWLFLFGILNGVTCLVRPVALVFPMMILVTAWFDSKPFLKTFMQFALVMSLTFMVCVPWGLRNQKELGKFILVSANFGPNFWMGNNENSDGSYQPISNLKTGKLNLIERDQYYRTEALKYLRDNPWDLPRLVFLRLYVTLKSETIAVHWNRIGIEKSIGKNALLPFKFLTTSGYYAVCLIVLLMCFAWYQNRLPISIEDKLLICTFIPLSIPFLLIVGQDRFHLTLIPFMILLAGKYLSTKGENLRIVQ